jgi:hypothetical protein
MTPVQAKSATIKELLPNNANLGSCQYVFDSLPLLQGRNLLKPVQLDGNDVSKALSNLTNTQLVKSQRS